MARTLVTTTDNKFNPFTQYDRWAAYDEKECGYNTLSYLARVASISKDFSEKMLSIHCDGRYTEEDVRQLANILNKALETR